MTKPIIIASLITLAMGVAAVADTIMTSASSEASIQGKLGDVIEWDSGVPVGTAPYN